MTPLDWLESLYFPLKNDKSLCWDASCINNFDEIIVNHSAIKAKVATNRTETFKSYKYLALGNYYLYEPIAFETSSILRSCIRKVIKVIC